ncbi:Retrotransposable element Tf2 protein [Rhizoctonia solani]|uniref:Retrotransposable element Tf2 protein n=1 Tax=Rhizoctonia solani TaxID=456999 RepID=A0A8H8SZA2_9AGAM|nr:Retrotransposable element Tf2 protein [Rhizoctonia solani]QRW24116.1 Retrotransposable element Tf2 protein [Rhizoctonia solani]
MEKDKVQAIMDWPEPQNVKQVQSFLGFANFYQGATMDWQEEQKAAFDAIKAEICKEPVLVTLMNLNLTPWKQTLLEQPWAVLSQRMEDGSTSCCIHELLAIIRAFEHWRIFLEGTEQPITVFTDHKNLEYWKSARTFNRRHARWHLMLASYNFVIAYRPGKQSQKPDALSRQSDHMDLEPAPQIMIPESHLRHFQHT